MWYFLKSAHFNFIKKTNLFVISAVMGASLLATSCGSGSSASNIKIPGVNNLGVSLVQDNMLVSMVLAKVTLDGGLRYNIPKYPNSYMELSPDLQSSGTLLAISISLKDILNTSLQTLDPIALPGGRALPGVSGGRLPAVAFSVSAFKNMTFYLGPKLFGIFIPVESLGSISAIITSRYYAGTTRVGNISLVGNDANGENAGLLLMLDLNPTVKKQINAAVKKYATN